MSALMTRNLTKSSRLFQALVDGIRGPTKGVAAYHEKVIDHYENPRNVGSLDKKDDNVGTGLVGAPACGDVMKLQVRNITAKYSFNSPKLSVYLTPIKD